MFRKSVKLALVGASVAASAVVLSPIGASAAGGAATLSVSSGTGSTAFNISIPAGSACAGSGSQGYRWESFIASASIDVSTLAFPDGPTAVSGKFVSTLTSTAGELVTQKFPAGTPLGLISGIPQVNLSSLVGSGITAGAYKVGIACTNLNTPGTVGRVDGNNYWEKTITVTNATSMAWVVGTAPAAPVLGALTAGDTTLTGTFTAAAADPAATYVVTTVPATVSTTVTPGTPFTLTGLTNGTSYALTVTATNAVGSIASDPQSGTPIKTVGKPTLTAESGVNEVTLSWTDAAGAPAATSYTVVRTPTNPAGPAVTTTNATPGKITLPNGDYLFTVQAIYGVGVVGTISDAKPASSTPAFRVIQDINVARPTGALVLTQKCGVYGALDAETGYNGGFGPLAAESAVAAVAGYSNKPAGETDARFDQYPYPVKADGTPDATYPTRCTINLSTAKLITTGDKAGQYFTSTGRINQVTVVDTRDSDSAWNIGGQMSDFTNGTNGRTFSGNLMGWTPKLTADSGPTLSGATTAASYDQTVVQGAAVSPVQGLATGLKDGKSLGSAVAGKGLGIATLDARLKLLIPLTATDGTYAATLTFTSI